MSLRRLAQINSATASPRSPEKSARGPRFSYPVSRSPADTPSISSSIPFDWEAAKNLRPAPYGLPAKRLRMSSDGTQRKAIVKKKGIIERIRSIPSNIAFHVALFPDNVPLPTPKTTARIIGGAIHVVHLFISAHDTDGIWEDKRSSSWFDWTTPITLLLVLYSVYNAYSLYTRTKNYQLLGRTDPVNSSNARFVNKTVDLEPISQPTTKRRIFSALVYGFSVSWRFLFGLQPPPTSPLLRENTSRVQELDIWSPTEIELEIFTIYSPAHALLWITMNSNWITTFLVMFVVGVQMNALTTLYERLVKDKQILASEAMREYNDKFVYPRIHPVRRDASVMTHESEVVSAWD